MYLKVHFILVAMSPWAVMAEKALGALGEDFYSVHKSMLKKMLFLRKAGAKCLAQGHDSTA